MNDYFLALLGSSIDYFYEADSFPNEGDYSHARFVAKKPGCCPLNTAAVVSYKGIDVKVLDMLGKGLESSDFLVNNLKKFHIDTSNIIYEENVTNGEVIIINTKDQRTMFVIDPTRPYYVVDEKIQKLLNNSKFIYSLIHVVNRSFATMEPLLEAKRKGAKIIFDGSSKYDDPSRAEILYQLADGLFINSDHFENLKECTQKDPVKTILDNGGLFVCVTKGSKGSTLYLKDEVINAPALENIKVLDSTGAGDSFAGAFLASLMKGNSYKKSLEYATLSGAYACTGFGGQAACVDFETLDKLKKEHNYEL